MQNSTSPALISTALALLAVVLLLSACAREASPPLADGLFEKTTFAALQGWNSHNFKDSMLALRRSCGAIKRSQEVSHIAGTAFNLRPRYWKSLCAEVNNSEFNSSSDSGSEFAKAFMQKHFQPFKLTHKAFYTGYFEAHLQASYQRSETYQIPVLAAPKEQTPTTIAKEDTLLWQLHAQHGYPLQKLPPNYHRSRIENEATSGKFRILFWTNNAIDLFLAQIQGSAVITFTDGTTKRIGYAQDNGYDYVSIGQYMLTQGLIDNLDNGWFTIRNYLQKHPQQATAIMQKNPRYIFFRLYHHNKVPLGRLKTPLIPERSAAADIALMPYGVPLWINPSAPHLPPKFSPRLVFIHDSGNAIKGYGRIDIFFGQGEKALNHAALLRHKGEMFVLLPKKYVIEKKL